MNASRYRFFEKSNKFLIGYNRGAGQHELAVYDCDQAVWPESQRCSAPEKLDRIIDLGDERLMVVYQDADYKKQLALTSLVDLNDRIVVSPPRFFTRRVAVSEDQKYWFSHGLDNVSCFKMGDKEPMWTREFETQRGWTVVFESLGNDQVAVYENPKIVKIFNIADGSVALERDQCFSFRAEGDTVYIKTREGVEVWQPAE
ncbi:MAG: hypothetical protein AAF483_04135 [Planctomycetota bacterium]